MDMALPGSGEITLAMIQTEFGGSNPAELNEYYRGGTYVPNISANNAVPTSGTITLADFYGATAADLIPDTVNWADISGATEGDNANQTISGISPSITIGTTITGGAFTLQYSIAGGGFTTYSAPFAVSNGQTVRWKVTTFFETPVSGTVTVKNDSDGGTTLDTFTYTLSG